MTKTNFIFIAITSFCINSIPSLTKFIHLLSSICPLPKYPLKRSIEQIGCKNKGINIFVLNLAYNHFISAQSASDYIKTECDYLLVTK